MIKSLSLVTVFALSAGLQLGCSSRTAAATQTTPAAFAPESSDPKAVALVDEMSAKLGGPLAWEGMKQVTFDMRYSLNGELKGWFKHSWDRWNGRHRYEVIDMTTVAKAKAEGNDSLIKSLVVMYNLFSKKGHVSYGGQEADSSEKNKRIGEAYKRWQDDIYKVVFLHKLKDPGVVLKLEEGKVKDQNGVCKPSCSTVKVTFSDGVGDDTYFVNINDDSKMPEIWQKKVQDSSGNEGRLGFKLEGWVEAGGLKFAGKLQNLGVDETFLFENIAVGSPDDTLYIPQIR